MNIGTRAASIGVPAKTIRYYEDIGLLPAPVRGENGYRHYDADDAATLRFIHRARRLGFTLKDVASLLSLWQDKRRKNADVKALALKQIAEVEARITELESIRRTLVSLTHNCHGDGRPDCPILDDLAKS